VAELARQCPSRLAAFAPLGRESVDAALARLTRRGASQQFYEVLCRLDREGLGSTASSWKLI
jgi:hypothetical protein